MKQPAQSIVFHVSLIVPAPLIVAGIAVLTLFLSSFVPFIQRDVSDNLHWIALLVAATTLPKPGLSGMILDFIPMPGVGIVHQGSLFPVLNINTIHAFMNFPQGRNALKTTITGPLQGNVPAIRNIPVKPLARSTQWNATI